ncbi:MAG: hypothetical protein ACOYXM_18040 [Actinomycetota bacterium]
MGTLVDEAAAFLASGGRKVVRRNLRAQGLPENLHDDVVQETLVAVYVLEARGLEPESVEALVSTIVRRRTVDMLRGLRRRPEGHLIPVAPGAADATDNIDLADDDLLPDEAAITADELAQLGAIVNGIREALGPRLDHNPTRAAGALAVLSIAHGDAVPAEDCPTPKGGVAQSEAISWAGLFYGGSKRCFPTEGDPENPAMRQRRSRALRHLRDTLTDVATDLGAILEADDA